MIKKNDIYFFSKRFLEIEEENNLFDIEYNGLKYWDIVRYHVFYAIYFKLNKLDLNQEVISLRKPKFNLSIWIIRFIKYFLSILFIKRKYLFFTASRNVDEYGYSYDINSDDIISILKKQSLIIETYINVEKPLYGSVFNYGRTFEYKIKKTFLKVFKKESDPKFAPSYFFKKEYNIDINQIIHTQISNYLIDYSYYKRLLKIVKPKAIFLIQNGVQKGMFAAANFLNIPIIEIQHGLLGFYHPSYSYPNSIGKNMLETIPKYFLTYSPFWTESINFPVIKSIPIGNSRISNKIDKAEIKYEITVLYSDGYNKYLNVLIMELLSLGFSKPICIKLHPSLYNAHFKIVKQFESNKYIKVIKNEISVESLISMSKSFVAIQSTSVYQALFNDVLVFLYKKLDYKIHSDVFDNPMLTLVDNAKEIIDSLDSYKHIITETTYFDKFNEQLFNDFLESI